MDLKQLMPSNCDANRTSRLLSGGEPWSTFSCCYCFFVAFSGCSPPRLEQDRRMGVA